MLKVEAEEAPESPPRPTFFSVIAISLALAVLGAVALARPSGLRGGGDVMQRSFAAASEDGDRNEPSGLRGGGDVEQRFLKDEDHDELSEFGDVDYEEASFNGDHIGRQLGRRRRRRRRRKDTETTPAPAPDYSDIHYPKYIRISAGWCEDFGYEQITRTSTCITAGAYLSGDSSQGFNTGMPNGGWSVSDVGTSVQDRPGGCASHGTTLSPLDLHYYPDHSAQCGTNDYHCICALPPAASSAAVPYIVVRENMCETFGYQQITSKDACTAAAKYLARSPDPVAAEDSTVGSSRPKGCAYHSSNQKAYSSESTAIYFKQGSPRWPSGDCGVDNFDCICEHSSV